MGGDQAHDLLELEVAADQSGDRDDRRCNRPRMRHRCNRADLLGELIASAGKPLGSILFEEQAKRKPPPLL